MAAKKVTAADVINQLNEKGISYIAKEANGSVEFRFGLIQHGTEKVEKHAVAVKMDGTVTLADKSTTLDAETFPVWLGKIVDYKKKQEELAALFEEITPAS